MEFINQYLTYAEYKQFDGQLQEMPFNMLELEARKYIDKYTFGRLVDIKEQNQEVKLCMFNVINILDTYQTNESRDKSITSESTDGYSVTYAQANENSSKSKEIEIRDIIYTWLSECKTDKKVPYLYRGV